MSHPTKYQISAENNRIIEDYLKDIKIIKDTLSERTIRNKRYLLWNLAGFLKDKPFIEGTEEETEKNLKRFFSETSYKKAKEPLKVEVVAFYKWLLKTDERPKILKWLKFKTFTQQYQRERPIDWAEQNCMSFDEYLKYIKHNSGDIQFVAYLEIRWYSGIRPSAPLSCNIGGVTFGDGYCDLQILYDKKGTQRKITIPHQMDYLIRWVDNHPLKENKNSPLFINLGTDHRTSMKRMKLDVIQRNFRNTNEALGITRHITPYSIRHTAITRFCDKGTPDTHLEYMVGWSKGSKMRMVYDHNGFKETKKFLIGDIKEEPTIDILEQRKQRMEKEIQEKQNLDTHLETEMEKMKKLIMNQQDIIDDLVKKDLERNYSEFKHYQFPRDNKTGKEIPFKTFRKKQTS
jgi:site-specific recombinase XerD